MTRRIWIDFKLPDDSDELGPELYAIGRGVDPRGHDIEVWNFEEANRLRRLEAKRGGAQTPPKPPKSEAAE